MKTILIIDPEVSGHFHKKEIENLRKAGYTIIVRKDIGPAKSTLENFKVDLVISELMITSGEFSLEETKNGAITGLIFYQKYIAPKQIPTIFSTSQFMRIPEVQKEEYIVDVIKKESGAHLTKIIDEYFED